MVSPHNAASLSVASNRNLPTPRPRADGETAMLHTYAVPGGVLRVKKVSLVDAVRLNSTVPTTMG